MRSVRYANRFIDDVAEIYSEHVLEELESALASIEQFPEIGSSQVGRSLAERFGEDLRKFPVSSFVIVYRYRSDEDELDFIALPYGPSVE